MNILRYKNGYICITTLSDNAIRIRASNKDTFKEKNLCVRYGIYNMTEIPDDASNISVSTDEQFVYVDDLKIDMSFNTGFRIRISVKDDERFYGLGDADRSTLEKRGTEHVIWVQNVKCYIPFPMLTSSAGWGIFSSTTDKQVFDVCKRKNDTLSINSATGDIDIVIFKGNTFEKLINQFKRVTGFSKMLPRFAYGFTFVANQKIDSFNMINEMYTFRKEGIPCDVYGLEPEWMEKRYDSSVTKRFNPNKFYIPYWMDAERIKKGTFFKPIADMDFKLSLWLCCDYDLTYEEERNAIIKQESLNEQVFDDDDSYLQDREVIDENFGIPRYLDNLTVRDEAWFEHLKKFVDMGVKAFKLDGAWQIEEHPDRLYGNKLTDEKIHNLYPLIYAKQMSNGYEEHTGTRSLVYSSGGFAGIQQYVATWAGDTGGGPKPLLSMLNLAMSGHVNTTCDMYIHDVYGIHFGFLQPWSQQANWDFWNQPWLFKKDLKDSFIYYANLRYSLIPYLYSAAYTAYLKDTPIIRPLVYDYPDDENVFNLKNQYMLGKYLMVAAFADKTIYLPKGNWIDMFTNEEYKGGRFIDYEIPEGKGGGLFVKKGGILIRSYGLMSISDAPFDNYIVEVYADDIKSDFTLYEDDGISLDYLKGKTSETYISAIRKGNVVKIEISERKGDYDGKPDDVNYVFSVINADENDILMVNGKKFDTVIFENGKLTIALSEKEI